MLILNYLKNTEPVRHGKRLLFMGFILSKNY